MGCFKAYHFKFEIFVECLDGFYKHYAAAFVVPVYWGTFATKSMDIVRVGAVPTIKNHCVKVYFNICILEIAVFLN